MSKFLTFLIVFGTVAVCAVLLFGCSGKGPTSPTEEFVPEQSVSAVTSTPTETPTAVSPAPEPGGDTVYFERTAGQNTCAGTLVNPTPNAKNVRAYYNEGTPAGQADFFTLNFKVPGNGRLDVPSAQSAFEQSFPFPKPGCEPYDRTIKAQCDYAGLKGGHGAGRFETVTLHQDAIEDTESEIVIGKREFGEWTRGDDCFELRDWTESRTQTYTCSPDKELEGNSGTERRDGEWITGNEFTVHLGSGLVKYRVYVDGSKVFEGYRNQYDLNPITNAGLVEVYYKGLFGWKKLASKSSAECERPNFESSTGSRTRISLKCINYCSLDD